MPPNSPATRGRCATRRWAKPGSGGCRQPRALVCGCGALGSVIANTLARSGVGFVRIVDRDFLELNNLQRQVLFDEDDVAAGLPKAIAAAEQAAARSTRRSTSSRSSPTSITRTLMELTDGVDVILDGTDNFETRLLLNDVALKRGIPWVYGGCLGAEGQTMTIVPGRNRLPALPDARDAAAGHDAHLRHGRHPGADHQHDRLARKPTRRSRSSAATAQAISRALTVIDLWDNRIRQVNLESLRTSGQCPACNGERVPLARRRACQPHGHSLRPQRRAAQPARAGNRVSLDSWPRSWPASARSRRIAICCG